MIVLSPKERLRSRKTPFHIVALMQFTIFIRIAIYIAQNISFRCSQQNKKSRAPIFGTRLPYPQSVTATSSYDTRTSDIHTPR